MTRLGQHFLKNSSLLKKIITSLDLKSGETVVEVGPGHGELTISLATAALPLGVQVIAIERDQKLAEHLRTAVPAATASVAVAATTEGTKALAFTLIEDDALKALPKAVSGLAPLAYKIVGNIPYYITGKLLRTIGDLLNKPERTILMIQKEVAERICAIPPDMNRLAASVQIWADPKIIAIVPKTDFSPPPEVDSAIIILKTRADQTFATREQYNRALQGLFSQPRKTIWNNLRGPLGANVDTDKISAVLKEVSVDPEARPQDLTIRDIEAISEKLFK